MKKIFAGLVLLIAGYSKAQTQIPLYNGQRQARKNGTGKNER